MKNLLTAISPGTLLAQLLTGLIAYYLLIRDNYFRCSIATIIQYGHSLTVTQHLVLLGLIPIYIAVVIFGAALLSVIIGKRLEHVVLRPFRERKSKFLY